MKTLPAVTALFLSLAFQGQPIRAETTPAETQLRTFAACAGRLSALMEFQWMMDGPASERTEMQRAAMVEILAAVMPPDRGREVLNWRINAKAAQSALLHRAAFSDVPEDAVWAGRRAEALVADCTSMLLS